MPPAAQRSLLEDTSNVASGTYQPKQAAKPSEAVRAGHGSCVRRSVEPTLKSSKYRPKNLSNFVLPEGKQGSSTFLLR